MFDIILVTAITLLAILLATRRGLFRDAWRSRSWPHVRGHVIESTRTEWMQGFLPRIRYRYVVDGVTHRGETIRFGRISWAELLGARWGQFVSGHPASVYYDPERPEVSVLEPGPHVENITTLLLFVIAIASFADTVIGAGILWAWWLMAGVSIAGMGVVLIAMRILLRRLWSGNWRAVEGVILWTRVDEYHGRHGTDYMPVVRYRFEAAGVPFEGDRIWIGPRQRSSKEAARRRLESYRRSAKVMVSYDPSDPTDCVLERRIGARFQVTLMFVLSSLVLIITLLALVRLPRGC